MRFITGLLAACITLVISVTSLAQEGISTTVDNYRVFHSVFNSSFLQPEVASAYDLIRGKDQVFVNIVVTEANNPKGLGKPAVIKGTATNLMRQQRTLDFVQIREQDTVYYLAPLRITNEEVMHFDIQVQPDPNKPPFSVKFSKTLYVDK